MGLWGTPTAAGILAIVVMLILFGQLVPRRVYKDMENQRDEFKAAYELLREKYDQRFDARLHVNTQALELVQGIFDPDTDSQSKVD